VSTIRLLVAVLQLLTSALFLSVARRCVVFVLCCVLCVPRRYRLGGSGFKPRLSQGLHHAHRISSSSFLPHLTHGRVPAPSPFPATFAPVWRTPDYGRVDVWSKPPSVGRGMTVVPGFVTTIRSYDSWPRSFPTLCCEVNLFVLIQ
jgi:hypothetical protein